MLKIQLFFCLLAVITSVFAAADDQEKQKIVISAKQIYLDDYPDAFNPSMIKFGKGYLLIFRYCPDTYNVPWVCYIGVVLLAMNHSSRFLNLNC